MLKQDAIADFRYDPQTQRYRWRDGAGKGRFASKTAILQRTRAYIQEEQAELVNVGQRLTQGDITLGQFQRQAAEHVKNIHIAQAMLGKDGLGNMTSSDYLRVGRELKRHYYQGIDSETGRRYGLKHLAQEVKDGRVSEAQLLSRIAMYGESGKVSYWDAWKSDRTEAWGVRRVAGDDRSCPFCVEQASIGPRLIPEIPSCGCCPQCLSRCRCNILELSLEDAIARGARP